MMKNTTNEIENHMVLDGEWSEDDERIVGECANCGELIYGDDYHLVDTNSNLFCCKSCALEYYDIIEVDD